MDDLERSPFSGEKFADFVGSQHSIATEPRILVVDDDEDSLLLMAYALEPMKCSIIKAVDGLSALSLARTYQPDLILLDIVLPYMDGIEVISLLRKDSITQTIPVIAVTALAIAQVRDRLLVAGFNDYVSKPYMLEEIEAKVQRYLRLPALI
jgi:CheY-like chemotaxis protein